MTKRTNHALGAHFTEFEGHSVSRAYAADLLTTVKR
jgi:hypothetical protein